LGAGKEGRIRQVDTNVKCFLVQKRGRTACEQVELNNTSCFMSTLAVQGELKRAQDQEITPYADNEAARMA